MELLKFGSRLVSYGVDSLDYDIHRWKIVAVWTILDSASFGTVHHLRDSTDKASLGQVVSIDPKYEVMAIT